MGDKNGVPIAQECHEEILRRGGVLQPEQTLRYGQSFPLSKVVQGAYVDDLMIAGIVPRERSHCKPGHAVACEHCRADGGHMPDVATFGRAIAAYDAVGAQKAAEKITDFSTCFTCWGTEVDGERGRVSVSADKRRQALRLTFAVLLGGLVTKATLQSLVGTLVYPLMHRRQLMCSLVETYTFIENMTDDVSYSIPADVVDELLAAALFLTVAHTDVRAPVSTRISATDATVRRAGACQSFVPQKVANMFYRLSESKGEHTRLRWTDLDGDARPSDMTFRGPQLDPVVQALKWEAPLGYDFRLTEHINVQELKALVDEIARRSQRGEHDSRVVVVCDSRVVVGAVSKGRSSSKVLGKHLRRLCALCVAHRLQVRILWIGTKANPADAPSRFAPLPPPQEAPDWLQDIIDREFKDIPVKGRRGGKCGAEVLCRKAKCPGVIISCEKTPQSRRNFWRQHFVAAGYSAEAKFR